MRKWTEIESLSQSQLIHDWKHWQKAIGPKTPEGKSISKMNSFKHGKYSYEMRMAARSLAKLRRELRRLKHVNDNS